MKLRFLAANFVGLRKFHVQTSRNTVEKLKASLQLRKMIKNEKSHNSKISRQKHMFFVYKKEKRNNRLTGWKLKPVFA
jgi:hypothetical protein